tara:strand:- start:1871 stop:2044 length:174 start_codon:yes stop_codon:yes gene_type:complete
MNPERTTVSQTVVISDMTSEQLQAFFSGSMTWEEAHALFPGEPITITEVEPEEFENV